jgi:hypothetical protein
MSVYDKACLSGGLVFLSVGLNFLPLPLSIAYLAWQSRSKFQQINNDLDCLMERIM